MAKQRPEKSNKFINSVIKNSLDYLLMVLLESHHFLVMIIEFTNSQLFLAVKSRKGKPKKVIDTGYLACEHHTYMAVGVALAAPDEEECNVAVIGLGGGGLCTFLQHCFQKVLLPAIHAQ
jgi:hypothetical protein